MNRITKNASLTSFHTTESWLETTDVQQGLCSTVFINKMWSKSCPRQLGLLCFDFHVYQRAAVSVATIIVTSFCCYLFPVFSLFQQNSLTINQKRGTSYYRTIEMPENLAKPAQNWLHKCKFCVQTVSARVERLKQHKEKCQKSFQVHQNFDLEQIVNSQCHNNV